MSTIHVEASQTINARPEAIYAVLADYHVGHPAILPKPYFTSLTVLKGGQGAGTEITFTMNVLGTERVFHQTVSEPEPGRVLLETEDDGSVSTRFTVEPLNDGTQSRVTIASDIRASSGIQGMIEKIMVPLLNRRIYKEELRLIAEYVQGKQG